MIKFLKKEEEKLQSFSKQSVNEDDIDVTQSLYIYIFFRFFAQNMKVEMWLVMSAKEYNLTTLHHYL